MIADVDAINAAPKLTHETEQPLRAPTFTADVLGVSLLAAGFAGLSAWAFSDGDIMIGMGIGSAVGSVVVLLRAFRVLDRPVADWEQIHYQDVWIEPEPADDDPGLNMVMIPNPAGIPASFEQPRPGEFANWVSAILRDIDDDQMTEREKTSLSQNTATRRGWPLPMYRNMFAILKMSGWVEPRRNRAPVLTATGKRTLAEWLRNETPRPVVRR